MLLELPTYKDMNCKDSLLPLERERQDWGIK